VIIGPDFLWLHFPKCAGTLIEKVLRSAFADDPALEFDPLDPERVIWHQDVEERQAATGRDLGGKDIICCFRRLPHWMLSRINFEKKRSPHLFPSRALYTQGRFYEQNGAESSAEGYVRKYSSRTVSHWIRVEFLRSDFVAAFAPYLDVARVDLDGAFGQRVNETAYRRDLRSWFSPMELAALYDSCPTWRDLEIRLYGDLVSL
jgi:hypothetical protein